MQGIEFADLEILRTNRTHRTSKQNRPIGPGFRLRTAVTGGFARVVAETRTTVCSALGTFLKSDGTDREGVNLDGRTGVSTSRAQSNWPASPPRSGGFSTWIALSRCCMRSRPRGPIRSIISVSESQAIALKQIATWSLRGRTFSMTSACLWTTWPAPLSFRRNRLKNRS